ncbi:phage head closure protein [Pleionea sediminis]|uniref:phage head closure protein n=1 Tax=Pleionea sediminis TaxID=2569479 RepID=UPI0011856CC1|nr:phage head closure protein [Pleionea sediminis]
MNAGKLKRRAVFLRPVKTENRLKEIETQWEVSTQAIVRLSPMSSKEYFANVQAKASITHKIVMRYQPGITALMKVMMDGRHFEVMAPPIDVSDRHRELILLVKEHV